MKSAYKFLSSLCLLLASGHLAQADTLRTVALSGDMAPGTNAVFGLGNGPYLGLNNSGQVAFMARLTGAQVNANNDYGIWSDRSGNLALIVQEGDQAPGTANGVSFKNIGYPSFNNAGRIAFQSDLVGTGVNTTNNEALWSDVSGNWASVVREGQQAPGTASGVKFYSDAIVTRFNDSGQTSFFHYLTGTTNNLGIWSEGSGTLSLVARNGNPDPATGDPFGLTNYG